MIFKHFKAIAISAVLVSALSVSASATSIGGAAVNASDQTLCVEPNTNSSILGVLPQDSFVVVEEMVNDAWYKIVYSGATGYVSSEFLLFSDKLEGDFGSGNIIGTDVYLRDGASQSSNVIGVFADGTRMQVLGVYGSWYKVKCENQTGFIFSDEFSLNGGISDLNVAEDNGQIIVDTAMKYLGVRYLWAGSSPKGFDCSGFVNYVYKECGYSINRTAALIYQNGTYVDKADLQVGDAVCFSSSSNSIGHVGIYIGDGQFIHASSGSGCVIISDLSENYYLNRYVGARHIV
ncbi:MAG: C40 family peptidase [Oscillospiraceae bacterium]|nr:C40 family peptidase [Oscillospiraceae bacterium]